MKIILIFLLAAAAAISLAACGNTETRANASTSAVASAALQEPIAKSVQEDVLGDLSESLNGMENAAQGLDDVDEGSLEIPIP